MLLTTTRRVLSSCTVTLLLLMLALPLTAQAASYLYTYTGSPFAEASGQYFTADPGSYHITVQFTYDGDLAAGVYNNMQFVMTDGTGDALSSDSPLLISSQFDIRAVVNGLPAAWFIGLSNYLPRASDQDPLIRHSINTIDVTYFYGSGSHEEYTYYTSGQQTLGSGGLDGGDPVGTWNRVPVVASVPLPGTIVLLGSGLAGLLASRKKKNS